jgi:uncharacterized protein (DUF433 family)
MPDVKKETIIRTERGLTIKGTRITLYNVIGYLKQDWSPKIVREWSNLTEQQMTDVLDYIEANLEEVETEYKKVLANAEQNRMFWERVKREKVISLKENPENKLLYEKLKNRKNELNLK